MPENPPTSSESKPGAPEADARWRLALEMALNPARLSAQVPRTPSDVVYAENKMRVLRYRAPAGILYPVPLVMVAPVVMPYTIMDLRPGRSLVEYLVGRGLDVFMVDWGVADSGDRYDGMEDYVLRYLRHAVESVCVLTHQERVTLHGYCQGGLLAVLLTALAPVRIKSLVSQAGPIGFQDDGVLTLWARQLNVDLLVDTLGNVPGEMLRAAFQWLNPGGAFAQTLRYLARSEDEEFVRDYVAMNSWLNQVNPLPGEFFRHFIRELYQQDRLVKGEFKLAGRPVDLKRISCPVLTISSAKDQIVPCASAVVLNDLVGSADRRLLLLPGGHLGMTVGRGASRELWPALAEWVIERSQNESGEPMGGPVQHAALSRRPRTRTPAAGQRRRRAAHA